MQDGGINVIRPPGVNRDTRFYNIGDHGGNAECTHEQVWRSSRDATLNPETKHDSAQVKHISYSPASGCGAKRCNTTLICVVLDDLAATITIFAIFLLLRSRTLPLFLADISWADTPADVERANVQRTRSGVFVS